MVIAISLPNGGGVICLGEEITMGDKISLHDEFDVFVSIEIKAFDPVLLLFLSGSHKSS